MSEIEAATDSTRVYLLFAGWQRTANGMYVDPRNGRLYPSGLAFEVQHNRDIAAAQPPQTHGSLLTLEDSAVVQREVVRALEQWTHEVREVALALPHAADRAVTAFKEWLVRKE